VAPAIDGPLGTGGPAGVRGCAPSVMRTYSPVEFFERRLRAHLPHHRLQSDAHFISIVLGTFDNGFGILHLDTSHAA
jgi:hypothetical protein